MLIIPGNKLKIDTYIKVCSVDFHQVQPFIRNGSGASFLIEARRGSYFGNS